MATSPHPFIKAPNRTIISLSIPVLFSLIAEPLTGMVDTAFVASLGEVPLAALGVGTAALSSVFWIFSFLGISAQTGVAQADGQSDAAQALRTVSLALALAIAISAGLVLLVFPWYFSPKCRRKPNVPHCPSSHRLGSSVDLFLCWRWCF